jgi:hypothetical protein
MAKCIEDEDDDENEDDYFSPVYRTIPNNRAIGGCFTAR